MIGKGSLKNFDMAKEDVSIIQARIQNGDQNRTSLVMIVDCAFQKQPLLAPTTTTTTMTATTTTTKAATTTSTKTGS